MDKDDISGRLGLGITTVLTIMFLFGTFNDNLPEFSYPKALEWYLLVSLTFVSLTLVESMIAHIFASSTKQGEDQVKCKVKYLAVTFVHNICEATAA